jgi:hypothetical protein
MIVGSRSGCGWARSRLAFHGCDVRTRRSRRPTPEKRKRIDSMDSHSDIGCGSRFDAPVTRWTDIPIYFQWRDAQQEAVTPSAVTAFSSKSAAIWDAACVHWPNWSARRETASPSSGSTPAAAVDPRLSATPTAHRAAVLHGGGTMAGLLHRNVIACGFTDTVHC